MIIQNLHKRNLHIQISSHTPQLVLFVFAFVLFLIPFTLFSQDSIVPQSSITEKNSLSFQQFFFKALSEKAIGNYAKAIENLEEANLIIPHNKAVLFEFSKNYLFSNKPFEALEYGHLALQKDLENIWLLEHIVKIYTKERNYAKAIEIQEKIAAIHPKKKQQLVFLHLQNQDRVSAKKILKELEKNNLLTTRLKRIKVNLETRVKHNSLPKESKGKGLKKDVIEEFNTKKSFASLKKLLAKLETENAKGFRIYSEKGVRLFPAQPYVYLMFAKALNKDKEYKKALESLQNGIDFVIDDHKMELSFYLEYAKAYHGIGNIKEANKYKNKAFKLK